MSPRFSRRSHAVAPDFHALSPEPRETEEGPLKVNSKRRDYMAKLQEVKLESFLRSHGLADPHEGKVIGSLAAEGGHQWLVKRGS
eukprot:Skav202958  [mRNA]  locus=scaffold2274:142835:143238:+ [translate_table: standard]